MLLLVPCWLQCNATDQVSRIALQENSVPCTIDCAYQHVRNYTDHKLVAESGVKEIVMKSVYSQLKQHTNQDFTLSKLMKTILWYFGICIVFILCLSLFPKIREKVKILLKQSTGKRENDEPSIKGETSDKGAINSANNDTQKSPAPQLPPPIPLKNNEITEFEVLDEEDKASKDSLNTWWKLAGASVIGNNHISMGLPCQDAYLFEHLERGWAIAVVSDGAGSVENSHIGSQFVVKDAIKCFKALIMQKNWIVDSVLPSDDEWKALAFHVLRTINNHLETFSLNKGWDVKSLSATIIVVIVSPLGILTTHVGDGRAGYKDVTGKWKPLMTPHKGEEAHQTIFMTSKFWDKHYYTMSGVLVPESHVVKCKPIAFTLMSDGCERSSWLCYSKRDDGIYYDPNEPHSPFFDSVTHKLAAAEDANDNKLRWKKFLENGNESLRNEPDDKTMIIGVKTKQK